jgi:hypothetical protein
MKYEEYILNAIDILIKQRLADLGYCYYLDGKIVKINDDGTYDTNINGEIYTLKAREGLNLSLNNIVKVMIANGNFQDKFIDLKRP